MSNPVLAHPVYALELSSINKSLGPGETPVWALKESVHIINTISTIIIKESLSKAEFAQC